MLLPTDKPFPCSYRVFASRFRSSPSGTTKVESRTFLPSGKPNAPRESAPSCPAPFTPPPFVKCTRCIKDEEEDVLLVVKQQGEGDKTLVDENGNGSGHI